MMTVRRRGLDFKDVTLVTREDLAAVGQFIRQRILERTRRGLDAQGQPFAPYSAGYREQKADALGTAGTVNLALSGHMLGAMMVEVDLPRRTVSVRFAR